MIGCGAGTFHISHFTDIGRPILMVCWNWKPGTIGGQSCYFELPECKFEKWHDDHLLFEDIRSGLSMTIMEIPTC